MIEGISKIEFVSEGFRQILTSAGTQELVQGIATQIQTEANAGITEESEGFSANVIVGGYGGGRYVGFVTAIDDKASAAEAEEKVLTRAVHG